MSLLPGPRRSEAGLARLRDWDRQMQRLLSGSPAWDEERTRFLLSPQVDFTESDNEFVLTAELPGVDPEDVHVDIEGDVLTLKGEKREERETEEDKVRFTERRYGSFERSLTLPRTADPENVTADFRKGVLRVRMAKRAEATGRKIEIRPG